MKVTDMRTKEVIIVAADAGMLETVDELLTAKIGCLPVGDTDGKLTGFITEIDCLGRLSDCLWRGIFKEMPSEEWRKTSTIFLNTKSYYLKDKRKGFLGRV